MVRLYPAAWRERYGEEFEGLLEERPARARDVLDVLWCAAKMRITVRGMVRIVLPCGLAGALIGIAISVARPAQYVSDAVMIDTTRDVTGVCTNPVDLPPGLRGPAAGACTRELPTVNKFVVDSVDSALYSDFLANLIEKEGLYPRERAKMSLDRVIDKMRSNILLRKEKAMNAGSSTRAYHLEFGYPDPRIAQRVDAELMSQVTQTSLKLGRKYSESGNMPPQASFRLIGATLPQRPSGSGSTESTVVGLLLGLICGVVVAFNCPSDQRWNHQRSNV